MSNKRKSDIEIGDKVRVTGNTCGHDFEVGSVVTSKGGKHGSTFIGAGVSWFLSEVDWEFFDGYPTFAQMTNSERGEILTAYLDGETIDIKTLNGIWTESSNFPAHVSSSLSYRIKPKPPANIELGGTYTSKCGDTWVCIFIKDGSAWLTNKGYVGAAYVFGLDGKAKCLGSDKKYDIDLTQQCIVP